MAGFLHPRCFNTNGLFTLFRHRECDTVRSAACFSGVTLRISRELKGNKDGQVVEVQGFVGD